MRRHKKEEISPFNRLVHKIYYSYDWIYIYNFMNLIIMLILLSTSNVYYLLIYYVITTSMLFISKFYKSMNISYIFFDFSSIIVISSNIFFIYVICNINDYELIDYKLFENVFALVYTFVLYTNDIYNYNLVMNNFFNVSLFLNKILLPIVLFNMKYHSNNVIMDKMNYLSYLYMLLPYHIIWISMEFIYIYLNKTNTPLLLILNNKNHYYNKYIVNFFGLKSTIKIKIIYIFMMLSLNIITSYLTYIIHTYYNINMLICSLLIIRYLINMNIYSYKIKS
jgi:hypothetical protein